MLSLNMHTVPRQLLGTFSSIDAKADLSGYDLDVNSSFETPPGQKPALNSYLLWVARRRGLPGMAIWIPVPFYLMSVHDLKAKKRVTESLNARFRFNFDFHEIDEAIRFRIRK